MKPRTLISFFIPLAIGLIIWIFIHPNDQPREGLIAEVQNDSVKITLPSEPMTPNQKEDTPAEDLATTSAEISEQIPAPQKEENDQLQAEYDRTGKVPKKILNWSTDIARMMVKVGKDPAKAQSTFDWLKNCVSDEKSAESVRALCAANAKKLSVKFPALGQQYNQLDRTLSSKIKTFVDQIAK